MGEQKAFTASIKRSMASKRPKGPPEGQRSPFPRKAQPERDGDRTASPNESPLVNQDEQ